MQTKADVKKQFEEGLLSLGRKMNIPKTRRRNSCKRCII